MAKMLTINSPRGSTRKPGNFKSVQRKKFHRRTSPFVKKIIPARTISLIAELLVFASAHSVFAKPQKKSAQSSQENAAPLVEAAMKHMETGVWSVNGSIQTKRTIKLQGLLAGEDFD